MFGALAVNLVVRKENGVWGLGWAWRSYVMWSGCEGKLPVVLQVLCLHVMLYMYVI